MTVDELINELRKYRGDSPVRAGTPIPEMAEIRSVAAGCTTITTVMEGGLIQLGDEEMALAKEVVFISDQAAPG